MKRGQTQKRNTEWREKCLKRERKKMDEKENGRRIHGN